MNIFALDGEAGGPGVLIVSIPASPDAPHLIGSDGEIGIPFRDGSNTRWMRERDLERAYADRFARQVSTVNALRDQQRDLVDQLDLGQGCWVIITSRPRVPVPTIGLDPTPDDIRQVLTNTLQFASAVSADDNLKIPILRELNNGADNPRIGLRRWIARPAFGTVSELSKWIHVELHHDGSTSFAASLQAWSGQQVEGATRLHAKVVESAIVDAVSLATVHARSVGIHATTGIEVEFMRSAESGSPIVLIDDSTIGGFTRAFADVVLGSREVRRFKPVYAEVAVTEDVGGVRAVARKLCEDTLNQFGVRASRITAP